MKRISALILAAGMVLSVASCSAVQSGETVGSTTSNAITETTAKEENTPAVTEETYTVEETEDTTPVKVSHSVSEAQAEAQKFYEYMYNTYDPDGYFALMYPDHIKDHKTREITSVATVSADGFDLYEYVKSTYEESWETIHGIYPDSTYEFLGCVLGGSENEAREALEAYHTGDSNFDSSDAAVAQEIESIRTKAYAKLHSETGLDFDEDSTVYVLVVKHTGGIDLRTVYEYEGNLYVGTNADWRLMVG